jgi:glycosyltransferase involved in cell wall biosynthesis
MRDLSIIITACNEGLQLPSTLAALMEEVDGRFDWEILVVDNRSDLAKDHVRDLVDGADKTLDLKDRFRYFSYTARQSHWAAKNIGISEAEGLNLYFLDAHAIVGRDSIFHQAKFLDSFVGSVGGVHAMVRWMWYHEGKPQEWELNRSTLQARFIHAKDRTVPAQVVMGGACGMMIRKSVFMELGVFPNELGGYGGGEQWLSLRDAAAGYPHYIHPLATVWHPYFRTRGYTIPPSEEERSRAAVRKLLKLDSADGKG